MTKSWDNHETIHHLCKRSTLNGGANGDLLDGGDSGGGSGDS